LILSSNIRRANRSSRQLGLIRLLQQSINNAKYSKFIYFYRQQIVIIILDICWGLEFVKPSFDSPYTHLVWPEAIIFVSDDGLALHPLHRLTEDSFIDQLVVECSAAGEEMQENMLCLLSWLMFHSWTQMK